MCLQLKFGRVPSCAACNNLRIAMVSKCPLEKQKRDAANDSTCRNRVQSRFRVCFAVRGGGVLPNNQHLSLEISPEVLGIYLLGARTASRERASSRELLLSALLLHYCAGPAPAHRLLCTHNRICQNLRKLSEAIDIQHTHPSSLATATSTCLVSCACPRASSTCACTANANMHIAALSDHESSDVESVPAKGRGNSKQPQIKPDPIDEDNEEDSEVAEDE